jgi:transcriptional regulator with XRE-family HTH domain
MNQTTSNHKQKISRILGVTGWTQGKLANLMGVDNGAVRRWQKGKPVKQAANAARIDWLYDELVAPFICEIEQRADATEKQLLKARIKALPDNNMCK